jgi:hypothetical protein
MVAAMNEDVAAQRAVVIEDGPTAAVGRTHFVVSFPGEIDGGTAVAVAVSAVLVSIDGDEPEPARFVMIEVDEGRAHQVDRLLVPKFHLRMRHVPTIAFPVTTGPAVCAGLVSPERSGYCAGPRHVGCGSAETVRGRGRFRWSGW